MRQPWTVLAKRFEGEATYELDVPQDAFERLAAAVSEASSGRVALIRREEE